MQRAALILSFLCFTASIAAAGPNEAPSEPERYRIEGQPMSDECGGEIYLAARHITFQPTTMFADVVNRTYGLRRDGDRLVASGRFHSDYACEATRIRERWDLRRVSPDVLEGSLASTWRLRPSCDECTVRFRIRAIRVR